MSGIPEELIERVKDSADMIHLIGEHVDLRRTGADYRGPCPFHGGEKRNFAVIPRKQMFYCFVCHEGGDVFTFFMKHLGMDYPTAIRDVAKQCGISIPDRPTGGPDPNEPLYNAMALAGDWYSRRLRESSDAKAARAHLEKRGFDVSKRPEFGFGFAPRGNEFIEAMKSHGVNADVLLEAGLIVKREDDTTRPRFWNRLLIPIRDIRGRVVGFGGRILSDGEPKYLNSPDTKIFHKGKLLYNLHDAKQGIRKHERAIVVEGYFDVLGLLEVGVENVVASLGTAFTAGQAALLKRYTKEATILYDSDPAGLKATFRSADEMLRVGLRVSVATLPDGEDPDSLARRGEGGGSKAIDAIVADAIDIMERKLQILSLKGWLGDVAGRRRALDKLVPTVKAVSDHVTRDLYVSRIAEALGTTVESIAREVVLQTKRRPHAAGRAASANESAERESPRVEASAERDLIRVLIHEPGWRSRVAEQLPDASILRNPERAVLEALMNMGQDESASDLLGMLDGSARHILQQLMDDPAVNQASVDVIVARSLDKLLEIEVDRELTEIQRRMSFETEEEKKKSLRRRDELLSSRKGKGKYKGFVQV